MKHVFTLTAINANNGSTSIKVFNTRLDAFASAEGAADVYGLSCSYREPEGMLQVWSKGGLSLTFQQHAVETTMNNCILDEVVL